MDTSRIVILIFILVILFASPDSSGGPIALPADFSQTIARERGWLNELGNSTYGQVGNLTGYAETDWMANFGVVKGLVSEMVDDVLGYAPHESHHAHRGHSERRRRHRYRLDHSRDHPRPRRPWWHLRSSHPPPERIHDRVDHRRPYPEYRWHNYSADGNDNSRNERRNLIPDRDDDDDSYFGPGHAAYDRESNHEPSPLLPSVAEVPLYHNLTGMLSGTWNRLNVPELYKPVLNETLERNVTYDKGKFWIVMDEHPPKKEWKEVEGLVHPVRMNMQIRNEYGGNSQSVPMKAVHFLDTGLVVGVSNSDKFPGIFGLPHLTPTETTFRLTKTPIMKSLERMINEHEKSEEPYPPWIPNDEQFLSNPIPHCEYITYMQLHPIRTFSMGSPFETADQSMVDVIERELRKPSGESLPMGPPDLIASAIIYSPDCGFILSTKASRGLKIEVYQGRISHFALGAALLTIVEISLLIRQMNNTSTPSTLSRVSFWTVGILSVVGGYSFVAFLTIGLYVEKCSLQLLTASFLSLIFFMFFGTRYLMSIYGIQRPEREAAATTSTTTTANRPIVPVTNVEPGTLPLPVTATVQPPPDNDTSDASTLSTRLWLFLVATTFLTFYSFSWPPTPRYVFYLFLLFMSLSFWIPQIWRNCYRNCRKALKWEFVIGISLTRLAVVFYVYGYEGNVLWVEREDWVCWFAIGWVAFQIWVLGIQEVLGPRFLVPEHLLPPAYDYHPILPINDLEASLPLSASSPISLTKPPQHCTFDCAICMQSVEIPIAPSTEIRSDDRDGNQLSDYGSDGNRYWSRFFGQKLVVGRRNYMVTPCKHVFHSLCLEGWMRVRLQCPICRNSLPPI